VYLEGVWRIGEICMRYYADNSKISLLNTTLGTFILLCIPLLAIIMFCSGCDRDESPPDLSSCTRIEIQYTHSALDYFLPDSGIQRSILSPEEKKYIQSFTLLKVKDQERIKAFAHDVSLGSYDGRKHIVYNELPVEISCYCNNENIISFSLFKDLIVTENWDHFKYPIYKNLPNLEIFEPPEIRPFKLRFRCGLNMQRIYTAGPLYRKKVSSYPEPAEWCDIVMRDRMNTSYCSEERMRECFKCPSAGEGKCHYAMNPHCEPNSPPDTVLLFETKEGWDQHGGPELLTFDNHNPRGGCVLLNDGTVKFIRTKAELQQLRWK
jgi:hypothetical protein